MRGSDMRTGELFPYVDLEERVPRNHPLRVIRRIVNEVLAELDGEFEKLYAAEGPPSIAPERLLRALLLQAFYTFWPSFSPIKRCEHCSRTSIFLSTAPRLRLGLL